MFKLQNKAEKKYNKDKEDGNRFVYRDEYYLTLHENIDFTKYERVSDVPEFLEFANARSWKKRRDLDRGYTWNSDPFDFIRNEYGPWIEAAAKQGLTLMQSDILAADRPLWDRLQQDIHKRGLPGDIDLPNEKDARLDAIEDPKQRMKAEAVREWRAETMRKHRARQRQPK